MPCLPIDGQGFNYKGLCDRAFYQGLHKSLAGYCQSYLGYPVSVELGEEERNQRIYADRARDVAKVKAAAGEIVEQAEQEAAETKAEVKRLKAEIEALHEEKADVEAEVKELKTERDGLRAALEQMKDQLTAVKRRLHGLMAAAAWFAHSLEEWADGHGTLWQILGSKYGVLDDVTQVMDTALGIKEEEPAADLDQTTCAVGYVHFREAFADAKTQADATYGADGAI